MCHRDIAGTGFGPLRWCAVLWWSPFVWMWSRSLREVHEYQADRAALDRGFDSRQYIILMLRQSTDLHPELVSGFGHSLIKKRLVMISRFSPAAGEIQNFAVAAACRLAHGARIVYRCSGFRCGSSLRLRSGRLRPFGCRTRVRTLRSGLRAARGNARIPRRCSECSDVVDRRPSEISGRGGREGYFGNGRLPVRRLEDRVGSYSPKSSRVPTGRSARKCCVCSD